MRWRFRRRDRGGVESALALAAREWRETFDSVAAAIVIVDAEGRVARLNRAAQKLAGLEFQEILGRPVETVASWQPWREMGKVAGAARASRAASSSQVRGDRSKAWQVSATFVSGTRPGEDRAIVVARDVTAVVQLEASLRRAEAMAAMGVLVSGVAHEARNPIFGISATVDALEARLGPREEYREFLATLRGELERLGRLMRDLLEYGKPPRLEVSEADVGEMVEAAVRACGALATKHRVAIRSEVPPSLTGVRVDRTRIVEVIQNLVENALHHSPASASIEIRGALVPAEEPRWLEISVADHGPGFRTEDLPRIFEPFFSRRRGGTGLGLAIVQRIVETHGGTVDAGNGPDGGAVITFTLPFPEKPPAPGEPRATGPVGPRPGSRI